MAENEVWVVRAAGCVVTMTGAETGAEPQVLVVHRPRYDDWSFPKGKLEAGESDRECAHREVEEETGYTGTLGVELPTIDYVDHKGRPKAVRYWAMERAGGTFEPNDEVDRIEWLSPVAARAKLSYDHDRQVLDALLTR